MHAPSQVRDPLRAGLAHRRLPGLDGLRAVAALLVVAYHFGLAQAPGGLGVLVFFVLSGFLITWLLLREDEQTGDVSLTRFYGRRLLRIAPAFYCYWLALTLALLAFGKRIVWGQTIASALYANNYYQALRGDPNTGFSHTWTLAIEEQFYLLWPLAFRRFRGDRVGMARILAAAIVTVWVYRMVLHFVVGVGQGYVYEAFETRADHLMIGCLLAVVLRAGLFPRFWSAACGRPVMGLVSVGALAASATAEHVFGTPYRDTAGFVVEPVVAAILIAQLIAFGRSRLFGWLDGGWFRYLGSISYSIYLYQQIVIEPSKKALAALPPLLQLVGVVGAVVAAASVSHFAVERPFLRLKRAFSRPEPGRAAQPPAGAGTPDQGQGTAGSRSAPPLENPKVPVPQAFRARTR